MNFEDIELPLSKEYVFSKLDVLDLWKRYSNFQEIDKSFTSQLYSDKNPSCRVVVSSSGNLYYRDYGESSHYFSDIFEYLMFKYNSTFYEVLNIIASDFSLRDIKVNKELKELILESNQIKVEKLIKQKAKIEIIPQNFNLIDYNYWYGNYCIDFKMLQEYDVFSAKTVILTKGDKRNIFYYSKVNPSYAYRFLDDYGNYSYKIYFPLSKDKKFKWLFSGGSQTDIEGYSQLNLHGDLLILTKSMKDCMSYRNIGYDAISLQGEANKLDSELVYKLLKRFNKIIVNYDEDEEGIKGSIRLKNQYGFNYFFIDGSKDLSDYIKDNSLDKAKEMIKKKIKQLHE